MSFNHVSLAGGFHEKREEGVVTGGHVFFFDPRKVIGGRNKLLGWSYIFFLLYISVSLSYIKKCQQHIDQNNYSHLQECIHINRRN